MMIGIPAAVAVAVMLSQGPSGGAAPQAGFQTQIRPVDSGRRDLASAKALYASASYEEALSQLSTVDALVETEEVETYRALCLIALGRDAEAERSLERILLRNPSYSISDSEVSPRLVSMFRDVRRRQLPTSARDLYIQARSSFDQRDYTAAQGQFRQLLAMLADDAVTGQSPGLGDLKLLAGDFLRLSEIEQVRASSAPVSPVAPPAPPPVAPPPQTSVVAASPDDNVLIYGLNDFDHRDLVGPVEVNRTVPVWRPGPLVKAGVYQGLIEVLINERGLVEDARVIKSVSPDYDLALMAATKQWRFRPAMLFGKPVKYRKQFEIIVHPQ